MNGRPWWVFMPSSDLETAIGTSIWFGVAGVLAALGLLYSAWCTARENARPADHTGPDLLYNRWQVFDSPGSRLAVCVGIGPAFWPIAAVVLLAVGTWRGLLAAFRPAARAHYARSPEAVRDRCAATLAEVEELAAGTDPAADPEGRALLDSIAATLREAAGRPAQVQRAANVG